MGDSGTSGWLEYKRLVLAELERLNAVVDKLHEKLLLFDKSQTDILHNFRNELYSFINKKHVESIAASKDNIEELKKLHTVLDANFASYLKEQSIDHSVGVKWHFWAAVISIGGSAIIAIVSLIITLMGSHINIHGG